MRQTSTSVALPDELLAQIRVIAEANEKTQSEIIREALIAYVQRSLEEA